MSFESPAMLLLLAAVAVPLWLHFRRDIENKIAFPAVRVLAKVAMRRKKNIDLRHKILLAARILFLTACVLAVSRPGIWVSRPGGIRSGPELGLVLVIDDSLSMRAKNKDGRAVFDEAKKLALAEIERLRPGDGAGLILSGRPIRAAIPSIDFNLRDIKIQIDRLKPSYFGQDMKSALNKAADILLESPLSQKEIVVITDLCGDTFESENPKLLGKAVDIRILDAAKGSIRENTAVDEIKVSPSPQGETKEALIEARIANHSQSAKKDVEVVLQVGGVEVARGLVNIPARQSAIKVFNHRFKEDGLYTGLVRIPQDNLEEDNTRYFAVSIKQSINALIIDGDYRPGSYRDEAFYLERALTTSLPGEASIHPVVVDAAQALSGPLSGNDVVFLAGIEDPSAEFANRIIPFVEKGGGVFISPGSSGSQLASLEPILPAKVRSVRQAAKKDHSFRIAVINRSHPIFETFKSEPTGLEKIEISSHLLVEPEPGAEKTTLIELHGGLPLLMERTVGRGRVMLLTTTVDRDWTDLPIRPGYFPLIQRAARYLSGRLSDKDSKRVLAGNRALLEVTPKMQKLIVRDPDGQDTIYSASDLSGQTEVSYDRTAKPGSYRVWAELPTFGGLKEMNALGFVVETDPRESDLSHTVKPEEKNLSLAGPSVWGRLPIWPYLLIALVLLLIAETILSSAGLRKSHVRRHK